MNDTKDIPLERLSGPCSITTITREFEGSALMCFRCEDSFGRIVVYVTDENGERSSFDFLSRDATTSEKGGSIIVSTPFAELTFHSISQ